MRTIPVAALMLLLAACGRDIPGPSGAGAGRLLFVDPSQIDGYVGLQVAFDVKLLREDDSFASLINSPELALESTSTKIFTVDAGGHGRAVGVGESTVEVRYQD